MLIQIIIVALVDEHEVAVVDIHGSGNRILYLRDGIICGDLQLGAYDENENFERHEKLKAFLEEMGW